MFDVGFSELLVIAVVALLVLGPERLPKAARFAGLWVRRARAQWHSVKAEFERDLADDELKRTLRDTQASLREAQASLRDAGSNLHREFEGASADLMRGPPLPAPAEPVPAPALTGGSDPVAEPAANAPPASSAISAATGVEAIDPDPETSMHEPMPDPPPPSDEDDGQDGADASAAQR